uniref:Uncharacterized protein n=1 Tax=Ciona savignyi TaxID=51511 RepID=H2YL72_CIOSA
MGGLLQGGDFLPPPQLRGCDAEIGEGTGCSWSPEEREEGA